MMLSGAIDFGSWTIFESNESGSLENPATGEDTVFQDKINSSTG
jgi:hypothetical protein